MDHLKKSFESGDLIGIKGHIDTDDKGLTIKADKISFLKHKERAD